MAQLSRIGTCSVSGCVKSIEAKRYCKAHYSRVRTYGSPHGGQWEKGLPTEVRFMANVAVDVATRCWVWQASTFQATGYAQFTVERRKYVGHRWAYEHYVGAIPEGLVIDHLCRRRACVNPEHLEAVTQHENVMRAPECAGARAAAATHCPNGHPYAGEHLGIRKNGWRFCRTCHNARRRVSSRRLAATTNAGVVGLTQTGV